MSKYRQGDYLFTLDKYVCRKCDYTCDFEGRITMVPSCPICRRQMTMHFVKTLVED